MSSFDDYHGLLFLVDMFLSGQDEVTVNNIHDAVIRALDDIAPEVSKTYSDYRNYKSDFVHLLDEVYIASQGIRYLETRRMLIPIVHW